MVFYINDSCGSGGGGSGINRGEGEAADKLRPRCLPPFPAYFNSLLSIQQTHSLLQRKGEKVNKQFPLQKSKKTAKRKKPNSFFAIHLWAIVAECFAPENSSHLRFCLLN